MASHNNSKGLDIFLSLLRWVSVIVFAVSAYFVTLYLIESRNYRKNTVELTEIHDRYAKDEKNSDNGNFKALEALYEKNSDTVGYLTVADTDATGPILQATDNDYYLNVDFYHNKSKYGSRFADYRNNISAEGPTDRNTIIYGHYTDEKLLFAEINKYQDIDFYRAHPTVNFQTFKADIDYEVFACFITGTDADYGEVFDYTRINFKSDDDFLKFIKQVKKRSMIDTGVKVKKNDQILTLSTCSRKFKGARFVLMARRVQADEGKNGKTVQAK